MRFQPSATLGYKDHRRHLTTILDAARSAADPRLAMLRAIERTPPRRWPKVVIAVGKAAVAMDEGLSEAMGSCAMTRCIVVPHGTPTWGDGEAVTFGDHPLPSEASYRAARRVHFLLSTRRARPNCPGIAVLLSGGASSLLAYPPDGVGIEDVKAVTRALLRAGAPIEDLNTVRKHIDELKGGRMAAHAGHLEIDAYVLSDVVDDRLDVIGSGPVSPDPTTFADALEVLDRYGARQTSPRVTAALEAGSRGETEETPKPGDRVFEHVRTSLVAGNETALHAARDAAAALGFRVVRCGERVKGEARAVGAQLAREAALAQRGAKDGPVCILLGGETTVTMTREGARGAREAHGSGGGAGVESGVVPAPGSIDGRGGRCQELALACAGELEGSQGIAVAAFATDGVDGNSDAAGAIVTGETTLVAKRLHGIDWRGVLERHDSHDLLDVTGSLIRTGPTGTNVCDIVVALVYPPAASGARGSGGGEEKRDRGDGRRKRMR